MDQCNGEREQMPGEKIRQNLAAVCYAGANCCTVLRWSAVDGALNPSIMCNPGGEVVPLWVKHGSWVYITFPITGIFYCRLHPHSLERTMP